MNSVKIAALVPMRHDSERVIGKNYRSFGGKPLYHHIVQALLDCPEIEQVCIDTDSPFILDDAPQQFPKVQCLVRPEPLRSGMTSMNAVLANTLAQIDADLYLQTHSTNPLLKSSTISQAIQQLLNSPQYDSLFGVTRLQTRLYDANGNAVNHDPDILLRTQDLPPIYEENSNLYLFTKDVFTQRQNRIGSHPILFEIDRDEAWDIDEEVDFRIAEMMYFYQQEKS